jgi:hypothetical protein
MPCPTRAARDPYAALADECEVALPAGRTGQCWDNAGVRNLCPAGETRPHATRRPGVYRA